MASTSETFFQRTLEKKTHEAREAVQECVAAFLSLDPGRRKPTAAKAHSAVGRIVEMLHPNDLPSWLTQLYSALDQATTHSSDKSGADAMQSIANSYQVMLNKHKWKLADVDTTGGFDFDRLFAKYREENRIPELFDAIIAAIAEILASGKIDSLRVVNELEKIIATLKNARSGSYFATRSAWYFVATWFKNSGWEMLGDIPVLGGVLRGLRTTLDEMDSGMENMHNQIQKDLQTQLVQDFPKLEYKRLNLPRIEYTDLPDLPNAT
ncbi:MAG: hypothetical protein JNK57_05010 [Planctomycetaceae bacterium]|nr:hypothetical protein [Planctomycetaceae bacterium]